MRASYKYIDVSCARCGSTRASGAKVIVGGVSVKLYVHACHSCHHLWEEGWWPEGSVELELWGTSLQSEDLEARF